MVKLNKAQKKAKGTITAHKAWVTKHESTLNSLIATPHTDATPVHREKLVAAWDNVNEAIAKYISTLDSFSQNHATTPAQSESCVETIEYMNLKRQAIHERYVQYITECDKVLALNIKQVKQITIVYPKHLLSRDDLRARRVIV